MSVEGNDPLRLPSDQVGGVKGAREIRPGEKSSTDPAAFGRLLDELRALGKGQAAEAPAQSPSLDTLQQDLDRADAEFRQVMDLRQKLEDAYRKVAPDEV